MVYLITILSIGISNIFAKQRDNLNLFSLRFYLKVLRISNKESQINDPIYLQSEV